MCELIFILSIASPFLWWSLLIFAEIWRRLWAWLDDAEPSERNFFVWFCMTKILGFEDAGDGGFPYRKDGCGSSDGTIAVFLPALVLAFIPYIAYISIFYYPVALSIILFVALLHVIRFVRRLQKQLKAHISNKDVHC